MKNSHDEDAECSDLERFKGFLDEVKPRVDEADCKWREIVEKEAPCFQSLSILNPDENQLSDIFAELLDPRGVHGQGAIFLELFIKRCPHAAIGSPSLSDVTVQRESRTVCIEGQKRRIDILVYGENWGIGIENKPWAREQKTQFPDYAKDLAVHFCGKFLLIRFADRDVALTSMTPEERKRLESVGQFASWDYDDQLLEWIDECRQNGQPPRVRMFLDELSRYMKAEFSIAASPRKNMDNDELIPLIFGNERNLYYAARIADLFRDSRQRFIVRLFDEIEEGVQKELGADWTPNRWGLKCDELEAFVETPWAYFAFARKDWNGLYQIRVESQPKWKRVVLGVWHDSKKKVACDENIAKKFAPLSAGRITVGGYWDAHSSLAIPYNDWFTPEGFKNIVEHRETLKEYLTIAIKRLCREFGEDLAKRAKNRKKPLK